MATEVADGKRGKAPETVMFLSGDVHHSYIAEVDRPHWAGSSRIVQAVCSPIRNPLPRKMRFVDRRARVRRGRADGQAGRALRQGARTRRSPGTTSPARGSTTASRCSRSGRGPRRHLAHRGRRARRPPAPAARHHRRGARHPPLTEPSPSRRERTLNPAESARTPLPPGPAEDSCVSRQRLDRSQTCVRAEAGLVGPGGPAAGSPRPPSARGGSSTAPGPPRARSARRSSPGPGAAPGWTPGARGSAPRGSAR